MPTFQLVDSNTLPEEPPAAPAADGGLAALREEFDAYYRTMRAFKGMPVRDVLHHLAAYSARASELRCQIVRHETRAKSTFRTRELDPFLEEVDRQFRIWSRIHAVQAAEWETSRGGI